MDPAFSAVGRRVAARQAFSALSPAACLFTALLGASCICRAFPPAIFAFVAAVASRSPSRGFSLWILVASAVAAALHIISFVALNIASASSDAAHDALWGSHGQLLEGLALFEAGSSNAAPCAETMASSGLVLIGAVLLRTSAQSPSTAARGAQAAASAGVPVAPSQPLKAALRALLPLVGLLLLLLLGAALLVPTYAATVFVVAFLTILMGLTLPRGGAVYRRRVQRRTLVVGSPAVAVGTLAWVVVSAAAQNAAVMRYVTNGGSEVGTGAAAVDLQDGTGIAARYVQFALGVFVSIVADGLWTACALLPVETEAETPAADTAGQEAPESVGAAEAYPRGSGLIPGPSGESSTVASFRTSHGMRTQSRRRSFQVGLDDSESRRMSVKQREAQAGPPLTARSEALSIAATHAPPLSRHSSRFGRTIGYAQHAAVWIVEASAALAAAVLHYLVFVPVLPLLFVAANISAFPSAASLAMLPLLWAGLLLRPRSFSVFVAPATATKAALIVTQYVVLAGRDRTPDTLLSAFFFSDSQEVRTAECLANLVIFAVLCTTSFTHAVRALTAVERGKGPDDGHRASQARRSREAQHRRIVAALGPDRVGALSARFVYYAARTAHPPNGSLNNSNGAVPTDNDLMAALTEAEGGSNAGAASRDPHAPIDLSRTFYALVGRPPLPKEAAHLTAAIAGSGGHVSWLAGPNAGSDAPPTACAAPDDVLAWFAAYAQKSAASQSYELLRFLSIQYSVPLSLLSVFVAATFVDQLDVLHAILLAEFLLFICLQRLATRHWAVVVASVFALTAFEVIFTFASRFFTLPAYAAAGIRYSTLGIAPMPHRWYAVPYFVATFFVAAVLSLLRDELSSPTAVVVAAQWRDLVASPVCRKWQQRAAVGAVSVVFVGLAVLKDNSLLIGSLLLMLMLISAVAVQGWLGPRAERILWCLTVAQATIVVIILALFQFEDIKKRALSNLEGTCAVPLTCLKQLGVVTDGGLLVLFLAPWCVALIAAFLHVSATTWTSSAATAYASIDTALARSSATPDGAAAEVVVGGPDMRCVAFLHRALGFVDAAAESFANLSGDYGTILVWVACYVAAVVDSTLLSMVYACFLILDLKGAIPLLYAFAHIIVIYAYHFAFVPAAVSARLAAIIGLHTQYASHYAIAPLLFVFYAILLHKATAQRSTRRAAWVRVPVERVTEWWTFVRTAAFDVVGYEMFALTHLATFVFDSTTICGVLTALIVAWGAAMGRQRFLTSRPFRFGPFLLTAVLFLYQLAAAINHQHRLIGSNDVGAWANYLNIFGTSEVHVGAFFGVVVMHLANDWQLCSTMRYRRQAEHVAPQATLPQYLQACGVGRLADASTGELRALIPRNAAGDPQSCMARLHAALNRVFFFAAPVAIASFAAGVARPTLLNILLILAGLLQVQFRRRIVWAFNWVWPRIRAAYLAVLLLYPLVISLEPVASWVANHPTTTDVFGFSNKGAPAAFSWGYCFLLWLILWQSRVFDDYSFCALLEHLLLEDAIDTARHVDLMRTFDDADEQALEALRAHQQVLQAQLTQIRQATKSIAVECTVVGTEGVGVVAKVPDQARIALEIELLTRDEDTARADIAVAEAGLRAAALTAMELGFNAVESESDDGAITLVEEGEGLVVGTTGEGTAEESKGVDADGKETVKVSLPRRILSSLEQAAVRAIHRLHGHSLARGEKASWRALPLPIRGVLAALAGGERYLTDLLLIFVAINFFGSGTLFDSVPLLVVLIFAVPCYPFAPAPIFDLTAVIVLVGIIVKSIVPLLTAHIVLSKGLSRFISVAIVKVPVDDFGRSVKNTQISAPDVALDFCVFALVMLLKAVYRSNGVFPPEQSSRAEHEVVEVVTNASEAGARPHHRAETQTTTFRHASPTAEEQAEQTSAAYSQTQSPREAFTQASTASWAARTRAEQLEDPSRPFLVRYYENVMRLHGTGTDYYTITLLLDLAAVLTFTFTYYQIQGAATGSIVTNVQNSLLPGPYVLIVFILLLLLMLDRACYIGQWARVKWVSTILTAIALALGYIVWVQDITPDQDARGAVFFAIKTLSTYVGFIQLRKGYILERRHDPFTHDHEGVILWVGYRIYRLIPFLWELRICIDWFCERTALRLPWYLAVEDMHDTVYNRLVSVEDTKSQHPEFGKPIALPWKIADGGSRIALIVAVLSLPLFFYSTFNPATTENIVTQVDVSISYDGSTPLFDASLVSIAPYPGPLATWLERTRPQLHDMDIASDSKTVQLLQLSTCSRDLWGLSPQALRLMNASLRETLLNASAEVHTLNIRLQLQRTGSTTTAGTTQTLVSAYDVPYAATSQLYRAINSRSVVDPAANETIRVMLPAFYQPIVLNPPAGVQAFSHGPGDVMPCTMELRSEFDTNLDTMVRYWCLKCNSLFTYSNYPNASFPEWGCLDSGVGCSGYNFEQAETAYTPTNMYFAVVSDRIPVTISFLPNVGIIALYTTFVLAIGGAIRSLVAGSIKDSIYDMMRDPRPIEMLVRYIFVARAMGDLVLEESLYFELINLMRSPETLLTVTGTFPRHFEGNPAAAGEQGYHGSEGDGRGTAQSPTLPSQE